MAPLRVSNADRRLLCTAKSWDANRPAGSRPSGRPADQADDHQQNHRADHRIDDGGDHADAEPDAETRQQVPGDDRADDADHDVADQPETKALHEQAGEPARNRSDDQPSNQTFDHGVPPRQPHGSSVQRKNTRPRRVLPASGRCGGTISVTCGLSCAVQRISLHCKISSGTLAVPTRAWEGGMSTVVQLSTPRAPAPKSLYEIGEIPPLGHVPEKMYAWAIRKERHGPPSDSFKVEVLPTWAIADDEVLVLVMAAGVNYNGVWAGLGQPISPIDGHKNPYPVAGSDAAGLVWAVGAKVKRWKVGDEVVVHCNQDDGADEDCNGGDPDRKSNRLNSSPV